MTRPPLTPLAESLPATVPFVGPETQERQRGRAFRARIGANENGFGASPRVAEAIAAAAPEMWKYCDPENHELKTALAVHHGVGPENIAIGEGIDGLLGLTVRLHAGPGAPVVTSLGAYPTFNYHVAGFGARLVTAPYRDDREDIEALAELARRENAPLVYLANPDNPMASWWEASDIERFVAALPETTMLVLDEAYCDMASASAIPAIDPSRPNVLRMRTFSKAYGLAGMRCGYAIGEADVIRAFDKVRNHFGMSRMTQVAAAAALADQAHLRATIARIDVCRARISSIAADNGLTALPSATNFVAIDCGGNGTFALKVMQTLVARDVFVRKPMAPGLDRCIRVSCGPDAEIDIFAEELPAALAEARGNWASAGESRIAFAGRRARFARSAEFGMDTERTVQVRVTGRVQGVSFRIWAQAEASRLGLAGWVRNESDGSVSALLAGREEAVAQMIERLHVGPPGARVADVRVDEAESGERPSGFRITG